MKLGVIAMKRYFTLVRSLVLEFYLQMLLTVICRTSLYDGEKGKVKVNNDIHTMMTPLI